MSPSRKTAGPKSPSKSHALRRHRPKHSLSARPPHEHPVVSHLVALDAAGWHVVEMRPEGSCDDVPLWYVAITRFDLDTTISVWGGELGSALAELVRYASADA